MVTTVGTGVSGSMISFLNLGLKSSSTSATIGRNSSISSTTSSIRLFGTLL